MLIRLPDGGSAFDSVGDILRADEAAAVCEATRLVSEARAVLESAQARAQSRAESIIEEARREASAILEAAAVQARERAEEALARCRDQAAQEWHERHAALLQAHTEQSRRSELQLAGVVMQAVRRIVESLPQQAMYSRALASVQHLLRGSETVRLRVAEPDRAAAEQAVLAWQQQAERPFELELRVDASLSTGACVFESPLGTLDTSLEVQLSGLANALDRAVARALGAAAKSRSHAGGERD